MLWPSLGLAIVVAAKVAAATEPGTAAGDLQRRLVTATVQCVGLSPSECGDNLNAALAQSADELVLEDGTYAGSTFTVSRNVTIRAKNTGKAILDGETRREVLILSSGSVVLEGINVTQGVATWQDNGDTFQPLDTPKSFGGVRIESSVAEAKFLMCNIYSNQGYLGAGVFVEETSLPRKVLFLFCNIHNNIAYAGGGGVAIQGGVEAQTEFHSCKIHDNTAYASSNNRGANAGGGVQIGGSTKVIIDRSWIFSNTVAAGPSARGGGLTLGGFPLLVAGRRAYGLELRTSVIHSNTAPMGADVFLPEWARLHVCTVATTINGILATAEPTSLDPCPHIGAPSPLCAANDQLCIILEKLSQLQGYSQYQSSQIADLSRQTALIEQQQAQLERQSTQLEQLQQAVNRVNQTATELAHSCAVSSSLSQAPPPVAASPPSQALPPDAVRCAGWCSTSPRPASVKCEFSACNGCGFCLAPPPPSLSPSPPACTCVGGSTGPCINPLNGVCSAFITPDTCALATQRCAPSPPPPVARQCASWCATSPKPVSAKCNFAGCNGCRFCGGDR